jgi:anti-sigma B factor antagonist
MSIDTSEGEALADLLLVDAEPRGSTYVVRARGEIDLVTGPRLRTVVVGLLDSGRDHLVIDLEEVDFIDSTGLGILLETHRRTADTGGSMTVVCRPGVCTRLFQISGLDRVFAFAGSVDAALAG